MVEPFSEVGMVTQVSAIQAVTEDRSSHNAESLPMHLRDLLDQTSRDIEMKFNKASWRVSCFAIWIYFPHRD